LVKLLFEHGAFTPQDTAITAGTVSYFIGALFFGAMSTLVMNIYYALKKMALAVGIGVTNVALNIGLSLWLIHPLQQKGLALANSLSEFANFMMLIVGMFIILKRYNASLKLLKELGAFFVRTALAAVLMSAAVCLYLHVFQSYLNGKFLLTLLIVSSGVLGAIVYAMFGYLFQIDEVRIGFAAAANRMERLILR
jgi:putative peptidoglycan lipid II flippase